MNEPIVQFSNVTKKFPGLEALKGISFELPRGKIIGFVGPNGSGKSTVLKLMAGLLQPDRGTVTISGMKSGRLSAEHVVFMHETEQLYGFYKIHELIDFFHSMYKDFDIQKAESMLDFLELNRNKRISGLSKGGVMRLKLVLALSRRAPLILLDEPLSGLDPMVRDSIIKGLISFLDMEEQTVVLTTHEIDEIEPLLDVVAALKEGKLYQMAEVDDIRSKYGLSLIEWMKQAYAVS